MFDSPKWCEKKSFCNTLAPAPAVLAFSYARDVRPGRVHCYAGPEGGIPFLQHVAPMGSNSMKVYLRH